jgi:hypothetical protein
MRLRAAVVTGLGGLVLALSVLASLPAAARTSRSFDYPYRPYSAQSGVVLGRYGPALRGTPANVPLPPRRPPEFAIPKEPIREGPTEAPVSVARPGDDAETCAAVLASENVVAEKMPPIHSGLCGIEHPLMLKAIVLADRRQIKLEPPVTMRCRLAGAVAQWIIEDVAPSVAASRQPLAALSGVGAYECRGRNGVAGAILSEHATGNALDIGGLKLADGKIVSVEQNDMPALFGKIRTSACARFATVLGPGADASHKTHLHVDLQERRGGYKMCQWDVAPPPPAPQQQQPEAPEAAAKKN